jgi:hypothetical protein
MFAVQLDVDAVAVEDEHGVAEFRGAVADE